MDTLYDRIPSSNWTQNNDHQTINMRWMINNYG